MRKSLEFVLEFLGIVLLLCIAVFLFGIAVVLTLKTAVWFL